MATRKRGEGTPGAPGATAGEPDGASRKTHAVTRLPDGTVCIGDGCAVLRIPPKGDIEIDLAECDDDVKHTIVDRVNAGSGADFKVGRKK